MPSKKGRAAPGLEDSGDDGGLEEILLGIGRRIRELRQMQGLTLVVLSEFTGIDQPTLSNIEAGKYNLTVRTANRIARALGVHLYEVFVPRDQSAIRPKRRRGNGSVKDGS